MSHDRKTPRPDHGGIYPETAAASVVCACGVMVPQAIANELERQRNAAMSDAERYRWLRSQLQLDNKAHLAFLNHSWHDELDAAIDKARRSEP